VGSNPTPSAISSVHSDPLFRAADNGYPPAFFFEERRGLAARRHAGNPRRAVAAFYESNFTLTQKLLQLLVVGKTPLPALQKP
jgi:hypothetical protein